MESNYLQVIGIVHAATMLLVGLLWLGISLFLIRKKRKNLIHVLFFTIFYVYLYNVLDYTLLQFQSLLLLKHFVPNLMVQGVQAGKSVNLIPLATLTSADVRTSLLNIALMLPFGFGLPFISKVRMKQVIVAGMCVSIGIELLQLVTGLIGHMTFRVADINDVVLNTAGVAIGYLLFVAFMGVFHMVFPDAPASKNPIVRHIARR